MEDIHHILLHLHIFILSGTGLGTLQLIMNKYLFTIFIESLDSPKNELGGIEHIKSPFIDLGWFPIGCDVSCF